MSLYLYRLNEELVLEATASLGCGRTHTPTPKKVCATGADVVYALLKSKNKTTACPCWFSVLDQSSTAWSSCVSQESFPGIHAGYQWWYCKCWDALLYDWLIYRRSYHITVYTTRYAFRENRVWKSLRWFWIQNFAFTQQIFIEWTDLVSKHTKEFYFVKFL